ncbi:TetR/AcrR family transcriptional regulator [Kitasatospora sp. NPDC059146]|uniref:TetR/AcrR family transcriptional regulator n=1 Tax=Kitasatospora sp. NPDC059146 TaxID=3346741 RepID=UPI0036A52AD5
MSDDEKLAAVLAAAYQCFTRHGVRRTTMDDIAREAGMSRPGVYHYVRNKEDAFRRLADRLLTDTLAAARAAAAGPEPLPQRLAGALGSKLALVTKVWSDSPAHAPELLGPDTRLSADLVRDFDARMLDLLAAEIAAEHPDRGAREIAEILLALTRGLEADLSDPPAPVRRLEHAVGLLTAGLAATAAPL